MQSAIFTDMRIIKIWNDQLDDKRIHEIADNLRNGEIMIAPTDTLYAIMCDAMSRSAIDKVCRIKGINPDKTNLSIICPNISMASEYANFNNSTYQALKELTPGPYTFLCKSAHSLPAIFKRRKIVGVRIPNVNVLRQITEYLGNPLLTTSIQYEDEDYGINPELIAENYENKVDFMLEGEEGILEPSTILDCTGNEIEIIREGLGPIDTL